MYGIYCTQFGEVKLKISIRKYLSKKYLYFYSNPNYLFHQNSNIFENYHK